MIPALSRVQRLSDGRQGMIVDAFALTDDVSGNITYLVIWDSVSGADAVGDDDIAPARPTFRIVRNDAGRNGIMCHFCGQTSYHVEDVRQHFCGACHLFHDDPIAGEVPR